MKNFFSCGWSIRYLFLAWTCLLVQGGTGIVRAEAPYPVRGLCLLAPKPTEVGTFIKFIDQDLAAAGVNTLVLRIGYNFQFTSRPEMSGGARALNAADAQRLTEACRRHDIRVIPLINLLGHQSWASRPGKLLQIYPEFDETPDIAFPDEYVWPNPDGLYCKSYCPLHPDVHEVIFALVDEIVAAFDADAFHAGMDEVFYIGHDQCPRCRGKDKTVLFADEVKRIHRHLQATDTQMWMWGDRLIDGEATGLGMWQASLNDTHRAIDRIPKDIIICDWHYKQAPPTAAYFADKGFTVVSCPHKDAEVALRQDAMTRKFIREASPETRHRYAGMMQTVWRPSAEFINRYQAEKSTKPPDSAAACFTVLSEVWMETEKPANPAPTPTPPGFSDAPPDCTERVRSTK